MAIWIGSLLVFPSPWSSTTCASGRSASRRARGRRV